MLYKNLPQKPLDTDRTVKIVTGITWAVYGALIAGIMTEITKTDTIMKTDKITTKITRNHQILTRATCKEEAVIALIIAGIAVILCMVILDLVKM